jgi:hypothetical protein
MKNWTYYEDLDFSKEESIRFNIDTRDFYCGVQTQSEIESSLNVIPNLDTTIIDKFPTDVYYHTEQEVKDFLSKLVKESGGDGEWRMLSLISKNPNVSNWKLKYIRITRTEKGFVVCNRDNYPISKEVLSEPVEKQYLNHISVDKNIYKR